MMPNWWEAIPMLLSYPLFTTRRIYRLNQSSSSFLSHAPPTIINNRNRHHKERISKALALLLSKDCIGICKVYLREAMAERQREGAEVVKGAEEGMKAAVALLREMGLLPLAEVGFVRGTRYMWIRQQKKVDHHFNLIGKHVSYDKDIQGYVAMHHIKKLKGVKAKELMIWAPVGDIKLDNPPTGKLHFKSLAGITKTFPVKAFAAGQ